MDKSILDLISSFASTTEAAPSAKVGVVSNPGLPVSAKYEGATLSLLVFSKDRPYQLLQLLLSIEEHVTPRLTEKIVVLYACSDTGGEWYTQYQNIASRFADTVKFVLETTFGDDLDRILREDFRDVNVVGFCVDDLVYTSPTPLQAYANALWRDGKKNSASSSSSSSSSSLSPAFAFHTKLHPGIIYSHTRTKAMSVPPLTEVKQQQQCSNGDHDVATMPVVVLRYELAGGTDDWHYPFDLCGSLYRVAEVRSLLRLAAGAGGGGGSGGDKSSGSSSGGSHYPPNGDVGGYSYSPGGSSGSSSRGKVSSNGNSVYVFCSSIALPFSYPSIATCLHSLTRHDMTSNHHSHPPLN
jgi:hypothetical protein